MKPRLVIVDGVRTPFCKAGTDLARLEARKIPRFKALEQLRSLGYVAGAGASVTSDSVDASLPVEVSTS